MEVRLGKLRFESKYLAINYFYEKNLYNYLYSTSIRTILQVFFAQANCQVKCKSKKERGKSQSKDLNKSFRKLYGSNCHNILKLYKNYLFLI